MDILKKIEDILEPSLKEQGYGIVRVLMAGNYRRTLQIMIENLDGRNITLEDCETVSKISSVLLEQHDPISDAYVLEISSPGLDRPLVKPLDYQRFLGHDVTLKLNRLIEKRKNIIGRLENASETDVTLSLKNEKQELLNITIPYVDIRSAKLYVKFD